VPGSEFFADVPATSPFCRWIEELVWRGITGGCGGANVNYCPGAPVTRELMAVFTLATLAVESVHVAPCVAGSEMFADVPATSPFCPWIEELARRGITGGCGGGNYCPTNSTTRGQMAEFQRLAFGLTLYGP
jgi:hypothetical protein